MAKYEGFMPTFTNDAPSRSYRYFYKWGDKSKFYIPSDRSRLYAYVRDEMGLSDDFFKEPNRGSDSVEVGKVASSLDNRDIDKLRAIVGDENVFIDLDSRIEASITKTDEELINMHKSLLPPIVDAVVCPSHESEIVEILSYAKKKKIKVVLRSALTKKETDKKTIAIDLTKRYNKILEFNEVDSYLWVQCGMYLPILENIVNNAPDNFKDYNVANKYTIGYFPLEYEESTMADGLMHETYNEEAGYFGEYEDIVMDREYLTADGSTKTYEEGAILSKVKIKLTKYYPHNRYSFSYFFKSYQEAVNAIRDIYSLNSALPIHMRLSDPKETSLLMRYYMLDDSPLDGYLKFFKCFDKERCMLVGFSGGTYSYSRLAFNNIHRIAKKYRGVSTTSFVADAYRASRFSEMYVREAIADFGISTTSEYHHLSYSELPDKYGDIVGSTESGHVRSRIISASSNGVVLEVVKMKVQ